MYLNKFWILEKWYQQESMMYNPKTEYWLLVVDFTLHFHNQKIINPIVSFQCPVLLGACKLFIRFSYQLFSSLCELLQGEIKLQDITLYKM